MQKMRFRETKQPYHLGLKAAADVNRGTDLAGLGRAREAESPRTRWGVEMKRLQASGQRRPIEQKEQIKGFQLNERDRGKGEGEERWGRKGAKSA